MFSMWMANRYWDCLKTLIPPEDAEYQPGKICNGKRLHYRNSGWKNNNITRLHHPHFHAWYVKSSKVYVKRPYQSIKWRLIWKKYWQVMKCTWWTSSSLMLLLKSNMTKRKAKTFTQIIEQFKVILFQLYLHYFIWESLSNNYLRWLMKKKTINLCGQTSTG